MPFTGELMTCVVCGRTEESHPLVKSDWRYIEIDEIGFYACPEEFPSDGATKRDFQTSYEVVLSCCLNEMMKTSGETPLGLVESYRRERRQSK